ncbi:uncharacterized protein T551_01947 [Pneumocystis jirovecii RU7]|uniref:Uncharacterized protein n=1 Tax=Pneumocystis jirovecii (strain RU7) TaxID=1408657 RepID=A0A0W4ZNQ6_PNEJ7|nr:uncharacterized protein T551_01947 [Pneumocystis jirovecii RU7]KTW30003.1 hypothetical protein T551_01947 [Pneumocystis jirovecii RU7]
MILNCLLISRTRHLYKIGFRSISTSEKKGILGFKTDQTLKKYLNSITFNGFLYFFLLQHLILKQQLPIFGSSFDTEVDTSDS